MAKFIKMKFLRNEKEVLYNSVFDSIVYHFLDTYLAGTPQSISKDAELDRLYAWPDIDQLLLENQDKLFLPEEQKQVAS